MSPDGNDLSLAEVLLLRANDDAAITRKHADLSVPDSVFGFHAQQAVEKAIKSQLARAAAPFPRTHDLTHLLYLADVAGLECPLTEDEAEDLIPWGVSFRYELDHREAPDRAALATLVEAVLRWASR